MPSRHGVDGGAHLPVLNLGLVRFLGGPTGSGPTLTASGEPRVPLLRRVDSFYLHEWVFFPGLEDSCYALFIPSPLKFVFYFLYPVYSDIYLPVSRQMPVLH